MFLAHICEIEAVMKKGVSQKMQAGLSPKSFVMELQ
jgi:hypothetical protein